MALTMRKYHSSTWRKSICGRKAQASLKLSSSIKNMEKAFKLKSTVYLNEHYALFYWVIICKKTAGYELIPTV